MTVPTWGFRDGILNTKRVFDAVWTWSRPRSVQSNSFYGDYESSIGYLHSWPPRRVDQYMNSIGSLDNNEFIDAAYGTFLRRLPVANELSRYGRLLSSGDILRKRLIYDLLASTERLTLERVDPCLQTETPRINDVSAIGWFYWSDILYANELADHMDADTFLTTAFLSILMRRPDPDARRYYSRRLERSADAKLGILTDVLTSPEFCNLRHSVIVVFGGANQVKRWAYWYSRWGKQPVRNRGVKTLITRGAEAIRDEEQAKQLWYHLHRRTCIKESECSPSGANQAEPRAYSGPVLPTDHMATNDAVSVRAEFASDAERAIWLFRGLHTEIWHTSIGYRKRGYPLGSWHAEVAAVAKCGQ